MEFKNAVQELQHQLTAQSKTFQCQMSDHSNSLHNVLQQHMMSVEAKLANLRAEWRQTTPLRKGSSSFISGSLQPDSSGGKHASNQAYLSLKLEVPHFDGSDPNGWLFRVEAFFDYHDTQTIYAFKLFLSIWKGVQ